MSTRVSEGAAHQANFKFKYPTIHIAGRVKETRFRDGSLGMFSYTKYNSLTQCVEFTSGSGEGGSERIHEGASIYQKPLTQNVERFLLC